MPDDAQGHDRAAVRQIAWREMFPWLSIVRAFRLATDPRQLVLAALGILLTAGGWWLLAFAFSGTAEQPTRGVVESYRVLPWQRVRVAPTAWASDPTGGIHGAPPVALDLGGIPQLAAPAVDANGVITSGPTTFFGPPAPPGVWPPPPPAAGAGWPHLNAIPGTWFVLSRPFIQLFDRGFTLTGFAFVLLCALWTASVWGLFGGAITRLAAVRLTRDERTPVGQAVRHARQRWGGYFWAPLFPLIGALLPTLGLAAVGWLLRFDVGVIVLGVLFPLLLLGGLLIVILLLGLLAGWPLMWATISVEGTDTFDALSRTYAYVYQRPFSYMFYVIVATLVGWLAGAIAWACGAGVVYLTLWGVSWSAGAPRTELIVSEIAPQVSLAWPAAPPPPGLRIESTQTVAAPDETTVRTTEVSVGQRTLSSTGRFGARLIAIWIGFVELLVVAFNVSFFWSAFTAIYVLLRKQVDATEMDEVFFDDEDERFGLPPLETDGAGVPRTADVESAPATADGPQ